jgi:hypothetical protein
MLTCRQFAAELGDYLDDTLESAARAGCDLHMEECRRCRIIAQTTRKTLQLYKLIPLVPVPPEVEMRLLAAIQVKFNEWSEHGRNN